MLFWIRDQNNQIFKVKKIYIYLKTDTHILHVYLYIFHPHTGVFRGLLSGELFG